METINQIKLVLNRIRPFIQGDGGDVEFVRYEEGIVYVKLLGACVGCASADLTLKEGDYVLGVWDEEHASLKENSSELNINIYPNPAEDKINIELKNETKGNVVITNQLGQVVKEMNIDGKELTIDVEDLTSGIYFINVSNQRMKFLKN